MRKSVAYGMGILALALVPAPGAVAQTGAPAWLHVRVEEAEKAQKVSVNLPMTVVEAVLKASPELLEEHGKVKIGEHHGMRLADMRRAWKELSAVGDAELVTVESDDENVRVARKGDLVLVYVDHKAGARHAKAEAAPEKAEKPAKSARPDGPGEVRVEVPVSLVDALLSGEGDTLNVQAAANELMKRRGDIVRVRDEGNNVRIWIDEQNTQTASR
jgi:NADH dehydrogenase/NADH:ubiquinone oxidoreductase subunit G